MINRIFFKVGNDFFGLEVIRIYKFFFIKFCIFIKFCLNLFWNEFEKYYLNVNINILNNYDKCLLF